MNKYIENLCLACLILLVVACSHQHRESKQDSSSSQDMLNKIRAVETGLRPTYGVVGESLQTWTIEERMRHYNVPGVSIAVAIDGQLIWAKGYGVLEKGKPTSVNSETIFQAASLSKPVASLMALKLVEQGRIALDEPVNQFLSSWKIPDNHFTQQSPVTLRHLLSHRAGTTIHGFKGYKNTDKQPSLVNILNGEAPANTAPVVVKQLPGNFYRYSGGGFTIIQLLIEDLTGEQYKDVVSKRIFKPLNLELSNFEYPQPNPNAAVGHTGKNSQPANPGYIYPELAAAGLWTTPSELVVLGAKVADARNTNDKFLLNRLAKQLVPESTKKHGLGFGLNNSGDGLAFVHNGHNPGYSARWINYADGRASVAILTNSDTGGDLIREIYSAIGYVYGWKQDGYIERATITLSPEQTSKISGDYAFDLTSKQPVVSIKEENGELWIGGKIFDKTRFYAISNSEFFISKGMNFKIESNKSGMPVSLNIEGEIQLLKLPSE